MIQLNAAVRLKVMAAAKSPGLKKIEAKKAEVSALVKKLFKDHDFMESTPEPANATMDEVAKLCGIKGSGAGNYPEGLCLDDTDWRTYVTFATEHGQGEVLRVKL